MIALWKFLNLEPALLMRIQEKTALLGPIVLWKFGNLKPALFCIAGEILNQRFYEAPSVIVAKPKSPTSALIWHDFPVLLFGTPE